MSKHFVKREKSRFCSKVSLSLMAVNTIVVFVIIVMILLVLQSSSIHKEWLGRRYIDPDGKHSSQQSQDKFLQLPTCSLEGGCFLADDAGSIAVWKPLKEAFSSSTSINFTNAEIVNYIVVTRASV